MQATSYCLANQAQRKKEKKPKNQKKPKKPLSHPVIRTPYGLAFSYKLVRSKADWERWMESFGTEITRADRSFPLPTSPPGATQICPLI